MKIENKELDMMKNNLDKVTYVPSHANGNAGHPDCEQGVIIGFNKLGVRVLYSKSRTVQMTNANDLVWG